METETETEKEMETELTADSRRCQGYFNKSSSFAAALLSALPKDIKQGQGKGGREAGGGAVLVQLV